MQRLDAKRFIYSFIFSPIWKLLSKNGYEYLPCNVRMYINLINARETVILMFNWASHEITLRVKTGMTAKKH